MRDAAPWRELTSSAQPNLNSSRSFSGPRARSELAGLYLRVAGTLERSAQLAEDHAQRERDNGRPHSADLELECAARARAAAQRGRELAAQTR